MRILLLFPFVLLSLTGIAETSTSDDTLQIRSQVERFFNAMRQSDSLTLRSTMYHSVRFMTAFTDSSGTNHLKEEDPEEFIAMVGTPKTDIWDEQISDLVIQIDRGLAHVWMNYRFYFNGRFSHCGVNSMEFFYDGTTWLISAITDTRRRSGCPE